MPTRPALLGPLLAALLGLSLGFPPADARAQQEAPVPAVDTSDRRQVMELFQRFYGDPATVPVRWTGNLLSGVPGELSDDYRRLTLQRVNYFRAMSGLNGNVVFDPAANNICQQAALMFAAQHNLSHAPPADWAWWTPDAARAAAGSNIRVESGPADEGPDAVTRFVADPEMNNTYAGHRRWLLYPNQTTMGSGAVPGADTRAWGSSAIWVLGPFGARPASAPEWTAWPPAGFVHAGLVFNRWSFSLRNADFSGATVSMTKNGAPLPVVVHPPQFQSGVNGVQTFVGDNTLVWEPQGNVVDAGVDEGYTVTLENVLVAGQPRRFSYNVVSIDATGPLPERWPVPTPALPSARVSVAPPGVAVRRTGARGKFVVSLSTPAPADVNVLYTVGGTAIGGSDYRALPGYVRVPAGGTRAKVKVIPAGEPTGDQVSMVTLLLQAGADYTVDPAAPVGKVLIVDE